MKAAAAAIEDLRFGLEFASRRYRSYLDRAGLALFEFPQAARLLDELAGERADDSVALQLAARQAGLPTAEPTLAEDTAAPLLGMGYWEPGDAGSALARVQRAENSLGRMADQLASIIEVSSLGSALARVGRRIRGRKQDVREARDAVRPAYGLAHDAPRSSVIEADGENVTVWFGTNRVPGGRQGFGRMRAEKTSYGRCSVFVPANRRIGSLGPGLTGRIFRGEDSIRVTQTLTLGELAFWADLQVAASALGPSERQGLIFLHGYRTSFADAARRTAQLKIDLGHAGPAAFFAWPSLGSLLGYTADEAAIEGSELAIERFLTDFAARSGLAAVHVIAHSMGNRGLLRAMHNIASAAAAEAPVRFGQIFLAAPDVDTQLFRNLSAAYAKVAERSTLYVTDNDRAIGVSRSLHRYPRVGLTPPVTVLPDIDTIDASGINFGISRHGYAAEMRPVLADMFELMRNGTPPGKRFGIRRPAGAGADHWIFAP